jgi:hypothetical protein
MGCGRAISSGSFTAFRMTQKRSTPTASSQGNLKGNLKGKIKAKGYPKADVREEKNPR